MQDVKVIKKPDFLGYYKAGSKRVDDVLLQLAAFGASKGKGYAPRKTGRLAGSISFQVGPSLRKYSYMHLVTKASDTGALQGIGNHIAIFGTDVEYAGYVESYAPYLKAAAQDVKARLAAAFKNNIISKQGNALPHGSAE